MNNQLLHSYLNNKNNNLGNQENAVLLFGFYKNVNVLLTAFWVQKTKYELNNKIKTKKVIVILLTSARKKISVLGDCKPIQINSRNSSIKSILKVSQCQQKFC